MDQDGRSWNICPHQGWVDHQLWDSSHYQIWPSLEKVWTPPDIDG